MKNSNKINFKLIKHCIGECVTRLSVTIILLLLPLLAMPQSKESDQLYKQGTKLFDAEKYEEALPYFQKSDSLDKAMLKPTAENYYRAELKVADCWEQLTVQDNNEGNYAEALKSQINVVNIRKRILGESHPKFAESLNALAILYYDNGNINEAIRLCTSAMEIRKNVVGIESADYAESLNDLALLYDENGYYNQAVTYGKRALQIRKKIFGKENVVYII